MVFGLGRPGVESGSAPHWLGGLGFFPPYGRHSSPPLSTADMSRDPPWAPENMENTLYVL